MQCQFPSQTIQRLRRKCSRMRNIEQRVAIEMMFPMPSQNQKEAGNKGTKWRSTPHLTCYGGIQHLTWIQWKWRILPKYAKSYLTQYISPSNKYNLRGRKGTETFKGDNKLEFKLVILHTSYWHTSPQASWYLQTGISFLMQLEHFQRMMEALANKRGEKRQTN